jgi:hypothetical protein
VPVLNIKIKKFEDQPKSNGKGKHKSKFALAGEKQRGSFDPVNQTIYEKNVTAPDQRGEIDLHKRNPKKEENFRDSDNT